MEDHISKDNNYLNITWHDYNSAIPKLILKTTYYINKNKNIILQIIEAGR